VHGKVSASPQTSANPPSDEGTKVVVFQVQPPVYSSLAMMSHDLSKNRSKETLNEYQIADDENVKEIMNDHKSSLQDDQPYNRLVHCTDSIL